MKTRLFGICLISVLTGASAFAASISVSISGKGAVNDSTVVSGEPFSVDVFMVNDKIQRGFTIGFKLNSEDIKNFVHVADSGKGLNEKGDIKGHNGWQDKSIWDLNGVFIVETNWDGNFPDTIGFGGVCVKQQYSPHEKMKCMSMDLMVPTEGTFVIDSSFWPPSGIWIFAGENQTSSVPTWKGPHKVKVVAKGSVPQPKSPAEAEKKGN
jgi:hypothetical protein